MDPNFYVPNQVLESRAVLLPVKKRFLKVEERMGFLCLYQAESKHQKTNPLKSWGFPPMEKENKGSNWGGKK